MKEGKTTFAFHLAQSWSDGVVVWDPRHQIQGATYVSDPEELEDAIHDEDWRRGPIVYRPDGLDVESDFDSMCEVLFTPPERFSNFSLIIDEASEMQSAHAIAPHLSRAVRQHPRSVLVIQTTHSLQDWHRASKDLMSHLYCFRLIGRSLKSVVEYSDGSDELEATIKSLPRHHLVHIDFEAASGAPEFVVISDPAAWYSPATARSGGDENDENDEETEEESPEPSPPDEPREKGASHHERALRTA